MTKKKERNLESKYMIRVESKRKEREKERQNEIYKENNEDI